MFQPIPERAEAAAKAGVHAALQVHRRLGSGLLESVYEACLSYELGRLRISLARQVLLPVIYDGLRLESGFRVGMIVDESLIVQIKSVDFLSPLHEAQVLTYLKLSGLRLGLLINFNVPRLKGGVRRFAL